MFFGSKRESNVVGFVAGASGIGPVLRRMMRRPISLSLALIPSLVRPARVKRILDVLRTGGPQAPSILQARSCLVSWSIPKCGELAFEALYRRLEDYFRSRSIKSFRITVGESLRLRTASFNGWAPARYS